MPIDHAKVKKMDMTKHAYQSCKRKKNVGMTILCHTGEYSDTGILFQGQESLFQNCELYLSTTHCFPCLDRALFTSSIH